MINFLKRILQFYGNLFFPPFCAGCQERLSKENMLCSYCAASFFAFWEFETQVSVLAPLTSPLNKICQAQKQTRHFQKLKYSLFLKALLELDCWECVFVIQEACFEDLQNLSLFFNCEKFHHLAIYTDKDIVFLGDSLQHFAYFKTYFTLSGVKTLKGIFLYQ